MTSDAEIQHHSTSVLLIEDNPGDVELIREMLAEATDHWFDLHWAERLSAGLDMLAQQAFDILLLDFSLPDSSGLDTLRRVRAETSSTPVVVLTGLADEMRIGVKAAQAGAQDYLVKGQIDSRLLVRTLRYAIERKQIETELTQYRNHLEALVTRSVPIEPGTSKPYLECYQIFTGGWHCHHPWSDHSWVRPGQH